MAEFSYKVADADLQQLAADFIEVFEWTPQIEVTQVREVRNEDGTISNIPELVTIDNPVSPNQLILNKVQDYLADVSKAAARKRADKAAQADAAKAKLPDVTITVL